MSSLFRGKYLQDLGQLEKSSIKKAQAWAQTLTPGWFNAVRLQLPQKAKPVWGLLILIGLIFLLFSLQLASMQLVEGARFVTIADGNRIRDSVNFAPRGRILDRNGVILADNTASFQLVANPYLLPRDDKQRQKQYQRIADVIALPTKQVKSLAEKEGLKNVLPVLVDGKISHQEALKLDLILPATRGFSLDTVPVRNYNNAASLSHVLGYVGRASQTDIKTRDDILPLDFLGQAGLERQYDSYLRGKNGRQRTEIDAAGRPIRVLANSESSPGKDLKLTIDIRIQEALVRSLQEQMDNSGGKVASGVVINPKDGSILAMASLPDYDNDLFSGGIETDDYQRLINDSKRPLFNRAIGGAYPAGSSIKPLVASAALEESIITPETTIVDRGSITLVNRFNPADSINFRNFEGGVNGPIQLTDAIAKSSNVFFYTLGGGYQGFKGLGPERLASYYRLFGLGRKTGVDLPNESMGLVPDPKWTKKNLNAEWFTGDSYNLAIGQGNLQISPLQLAVAHSSIVNGGEILQPHISGTMNKKIVRKLKINQKHFKSVREGMKAAVDRGTVGSSYFEGLPVKVAGKTGTAEVVTRTDSSFQPHVWIAAHAPYDDPEILVVGMIENGRRSGQFLGPVAAEVLKEYFKN